MEEGCLSSPGFREDAEKKKKESAWKPSREGEAQRLRPAWPRPCATLTHFGALVHGAHEGSGAEGVLVGARACHIPDRKQ